MFLSHMTQIECVASFHLSASRLPYSPSKLDISASGLIRSSGFFLNHVRNGTNYSLPLLPPPMGRKVWEGHAASAYSPTALFRSIQDRGQQSHSVRWLSSSLSFTPLSLYVCVCVGPCVCVCKSVCACVCVCVSGVCTCACTDTAPISSS